MRLSQNAMKNLLRESKKNVGYHDKETNNTSNNDYSSNKSDLELANKDQELKITASWQSSGWANGAWNGEHQPNSP